MTRIIGEVLIGVIYIAIVFMLVRPGSPASDSIKTVGTALTAVVGSVTGYKQQQQSGGIST